MVPDAECLKIACEVLDGLQIGDFTIKVRSATAYSRLADQSCRSTIAKSWMESSQSAVYQKTKFGQFRLPLTN